MDVSHQLNHVNLVLLFSLFYTSSSASILAYSTLYIKANIQHQKCRPFGNRNGKKKMIYKVFFHSFIKKLTITKQTFNFRILCFSNVRLIRWIAQINHAVVAVWLGEFFT